MKTLFVTSTICAVSSILTGLALSCVDVIPTPNSKRELVQIFLALLISAVFWSVLAIWAGVKLRMSKNPLPLSLWLRVALILISAAYILALLFGIVA
jgi:hypothetical protein